MRVRCVSKYQYQNVCCMSLFLGCLHYCFWYMHTIQYTCCCRFAHFTCVCIIYFVFFLFSALALFNFNLVLVELCCVSVLVACWFRSILSFFRFPLSCWISISICFVIVLCRCQLNECIAPITIAPVQFSSLLFFSLPLHLLTFILTLPIYMFMYIPFTQFF